MRLKSVGKIWELLTDAEFAGTSETDFRFREMLLQADPVRQELLINILRSGIKVQPSVDWAGKVFTVGQEVASDYLQLATQVQPSVGLTEWQELSKIWLSFLTEKRPLSKWPADASLRNVKQLVSEYIGAVSEVVRVVGTVDEKEDVISICTIIDSADSFLRYRVYEAEEKVLDALPLVSFDFRVVNLCNFPRADIATLSEVEGEVLYQKVSVVSNAEEAFRFSDLPQGVSYAYAG